MSCLSFAYSSSAEDIDDEGVYYLEPITVTAEKRPAELQKTPISVLAFTSDTIENSGIIAIQELALQSPGLVIGNSSNTSTPEIFIRGIGTTDISPGSDASVGLYVDDVYIGRDKGMFFELFDLERIEVLRGPQGTLYGRNTIAGAINIITNKPTNKFTMSHQLKYGNFEFFNINGMLNGPIIKDYLFGRLSYSYSDRDGYSKNVFNGSRVADADNLSTRGSIWILPSDNVDILLSVDYSKDRPTAAAFKPLLTGESILGGQLTPVFGSITVAPNPGNPFDPFNHVEPSDPFKVNQDLATIENRDIFGASGKLTWDLDNLSLVSISAYRKLDYNLVDNFDGLSVRLLDFLQDLEQKQFSQELRLTTISEDQLKWIAGLFFFYETSDEATTTAFQDLGSLFGPGNFSATNFSEVEVYSYALYSEGTYNITNHLSATIGLRYTYEEKDFKVERITNDLAALGDPGFGKSTEDDEWYALTPKFGLQFQPSAELMYYGTVSRGFKSGGFNSLQTQREDSFDPEFLWAFEIGAKSTWLEKRLQLNVAAFVYNHDDLQVQTIISEGGFDRLATTNAAEAEAYGIEFEISSRPLLGFDINAGIALLETEFKKFINASGADASGNSLKRSPKLSTNLTVQYTFPINEVGYFILRAEHQYQSKIYFTETNESVLSEGGFHNINARAGYETENGRFSIAVFGKNLMDEETINFAIDLRNQLGTVNRIFNHPRTYGVELTYHF